MQGRKQVFSEQVEYTCAIESSTSNKDAEDEAAKGKIGLQ